MNRADAVSLVHAYRDAVEEIDALIHRVSRDRATYPNLRDHPDYATAAAARNSAHSALVDALTGGAA